MMFAAFAYLVGWGFYSSPLFPSVEGVERLALGFGLGVVACFVIECIIGDYSPADRAAR